MSNAELDLDIQEQLLVEVIKKGNPPVELDRLHTLVFYVDQALGEIKIPRLNLEPYQMLFCGPYSEPLTALLKKIDRERGLTLLDADGVHMKYPLDIDLPLPIRNGLDVVIERISPQGWIDPRLLLKESAAFCRKTPLRQYIRR